MTVGDMGSLFFNCLLFCKEKCIVKSSILMLNHVLFFAVYKKHDSPSLRDEIWRLKNIGKDGVFCKRLIEKGIKTVQQFLRFLVTNPDELRTVSKPLKSMYSFG